MFTKKFIYHKIQKGVGIFKMKKFLAGSILVFMFCNSAFASGLSGYFTVDWEKAGDYFSEKWDDVTEWFGGSNDKRKNSASDDILPEHLASDWDKLTEDLTGALKLRDKNDKLPKNSWIPFKEDQKSNSKKINALLDATLKILVGGEAGDLRHEATELREKLSRQRVELDGLRNKKINAPENTYMFWKKTRQEIEKNISRLEKEISDGDARLSEINTHLTSALKNIGLELENSQTEILLNSVTGDDLLQNTIVFSNVKIVVTKLEQLSQNDTNNFEIIRRYTGMYLVLNDLLIHTQEELVRRIDNDYKPKLKIIKTEAETLRKDALTKSNQDIYTKDQRKSFAANAKSNEITIQVADLYNELLDSQKLATMNSIKSLRLNRDLAENTYRTVRSSGELKGLIHSGLSIFDAIDTLTMPELKIFETGAMRVEFEEINRRLKK